MGKEALLPDGVPPKYRGLGIQWRKWLLGIEVVIDIASKRTIC